MIKNIIAIGFVSGILLFAALIFFAGNRSIQVSEQKTELPPQAQVRNEIIPPTNPATPTSNATENLIQSLNQELSQEPGVLGTVDPEEIAEKLLDNGLSSIDPTKIIPEVNLSNIKITTASDKTTTANYFKNLFAIIEKNMGDLNADFSNPSLADLSSYANAYEKIIKQLYQLIAPQPVAELHKEAIRLITARQNIFKNLVDYENDPALAMVSANLLRAVDDQFRNLVQAQIKFIKENGVEI